MDDGYRCSLCWTSFETPVALLLHEIEEEGRTYLYAPSTAAATQ